MSKLGKRISIVGVSASGKSTFARKLAAKTGLPLVHVDSIMWKPGWQHLGDDETAKKLIEVTLGAEWVLEGYITKAARDTLFERADSIIYLDYPPFVAAGRYIKRWWKHRKQPRPELEGSPEEFSLDALVRIWRKGEAISLREALRRLSDPQKIIVLKSPLLEL